jgi:hypothetical protein
MLFCLYVKMIVCRFANRRPVEVRNTQNSSPQAVPVPTKLIFDSLPVHFVKKTCPIQIVFLCRNNSPEGGFSSRKSGNSVE